jgi:hypothetical protein
MCHERRQPPAQLRTRRAGGGFIGTSWEVLGELRGPANHPLHRTRGLTALRSWRVCRPVPLSPPIRRPGATERGRLACSCVCLTTATWPARPQTAGEIDETRATMSRRPSTEGRSMLSSATQRSSPSRRVRGGASSIKSHRWRGRWPRPADGGCGARPAGRIPYRTDRRRTAVGRTSRCTGPGPHGVDGSPSGPGR